VPNTSVAKSKHTQLYIGGDWREGSAGGTLNVPDPATEEVCGTVAVATVADLDAAADAAADSFETWRDVAAFDRSRLLRTAAQLLRERAATIAPLLTLQQGKPLTEAKIEIAGAADVVDWFAEEARRTYGTVIPARATSVTQLVVNEPVGPVATFTPWNFPLIAIVRKLAAALAAGCTVVVKGSEETPASVAALIEVFVDAGFPKGTINLVFGNPSEISSHLIAHRAIRKISFTGSTAVGKQLASLSGLHMKRATMELGGHAPVIVTADADIANAIKTSAFAKFRNAGQICIAPTRFLVEEPVHQAFVEGFVEAARAIKVGNGFADGTTMGPLANARRVPALLELVSDAVNRGAKLATGGRRIGNKGYFFEPTVLVDVPTDARIMNEEPFGPVALINRFTRLEDAIAESNRLPYGLATYAYTKSLSTAQTLARRVDTGMLSVNHAGLSFPEVRFGGVKDSGFGAEGGPDAIEAYLAPRFVSLA
jgi:succinate-semialdehyde dehydrogenase/glutarate-semialdehyde dehydrogenase